MWVLGLWWLLSFGFWGGFLGRLCLCGVGIIYMLRISGRCWGVRSGFDSVAWGCCGSGLVLGSLLVSGLLWIWGWVGVVGWF